MACCLFEVIIWTNDELWSIEWTLREHIQLDLIQNTERFCL